MKKIILAFITVAFIGLGGAPAFADALPAAVDCVDKPSSTPGDPCYNPAIYPPTTPATSVSPPTTAETTTTSQAVAPPYVILPKTGSGISSVLGIGALLLIGGALIVVAARRRSTATSSAS